MITRRLQIFLLQILQFSPKLKKIGRVLYYQKYYFQDLSNSVLQAPKFQTYQLVDQKNKYALKFLSSRWPTLFDETCGSKFKG